MPAPGVVGRAHSRPGAGRAAQVEPPSIGPIRARVACCGTVGVRVCGGMLACRAQATVPYRESGAGGNGLEAQTPEETHHLQYLVFSCHVIACRVCYMV